MATRANPYRDPNIANALNNIASLFAPMSGADHAGYANAAAAKAKSDQLAWLFNNANDPTASSRAALTGVQNYSQTPAGFLTTDATNRRGQDVTAATSRANNAADNQRAFAQTRYGPLNEGQTLPPLPGNVGQLFNLPEQGGVNGAMRLNQGQDVILPDGSRVAGPEKPLTESETLGAIIRGMPRQVQEDFARGSQAPVITLGPDGRPAYINPGEAARTGAPAAAPPGNAPRRSEGVAVIDGRQVPVTRAPDGLQWQLPDGSPVPNGAQVMDLPKATGTAEQVGLPTTANNTAANNQTAETTRALAILDLYEDLINKNPGAIGLVGSIRGTAQNLASSLKDLSASFGARAPQIGEAAIAVQDGLRGIAPEYFDPAIPEADFLQGTLAYALARTENPSGEVSRQSFERALDRVRGGGLLANSDAARAAIGANRKVLQTQLQAIQTLRGQQPGRTDPGFTPPAAPPRAQTEVPVERWTRGADGKLTKVQ